MKREKRLGSAAKAARISVVLWWRPQVLFSLFDDGIHGGPLEAERVAETIRFCRAQIKFSHRLPAKMTRVVPRLMKGRVQVIYGVADGLVLRSPWLKFARMVTRTDTDQLVRVFLYHKRNA